MEEKGCDDKLENILKVFIFVTIFLYLFIQVIKFDVEQLVQLSPLLPVALICLVGAAGG